MIDARTAETIIAAAIRRNGATYSLPQPARHHDICRFMREQGLETGTLQDQGFITSRGRFVDRREACLIAREARQLIRKTQPDYELFSEDVW